MSEQAQKAPAVVRHERPRIHLGALAPYSGLIVWALTIAIFSIWLPNTFATTATLKLVMGDQAITAILAVAILLPYAAGMIDLQFASVMGLSLVGFAWLGAETGVPEAAAMLLAVGGGCLAGAIAGAFVVGLRINSFIVTLAMSSVVLGITELVSSGGTVSGGVSKDFQAFALGRFLGLPNSFWALIVLAAVMWYVLERTPFGRRVFAVGGNPEAARLTGIRVGRLRVIALVAAGGLSAAAGILLAGKLGIASDAVGPGYLLPAVAGVFLGSTQISGRFNVIGTLIAVYLLGTISKGLQLAGADSWVVSFFNGVALLAAVSLAALRVRSERGGS